jgi:hypothetical protein
MCRDCSCKSCLEMLILSVGWNLLSVFGSCLILFSDSVSLIASSTYWDVLLVSQSRAHPPTGMFCLCRKAGHIHLLGYSACVAKQGTSTYWDVLFVSQSRAHPPTGMFCLCRKAGHIHLLGRSACVAKQGTSTSFHVFYNSSFYAHSTTRQN